MAEKSSELNNYNENDAVSTAAGAKQDEYLEKRSDDYESTDVDVREYNDDTDDATDDATEETEQLKTQIEETRSQMGETINAIQEKLSIQNITEQVKDQVSEQITDAVEMLKTTVSDATIVKAGKIMKNIGQEIKKSNVIKLAGENPLPLVLIGLGLGLLAFSGKKTSSSKYEKYRYRENFRDTETGDSQKKKSGDKAAGISQTIGNTANSAYESVSGAADSTYRAVSDTAGDAYDKIGDLGGQLQRQYNTHLNENPLIIGAVALAVGAAVGFSIPLTDYEEKLMGETRDNLMSKAGDTARGALDKVQDVVGQTKDTIIEEIKTQTTTN